MGDDFEASAEMGGQIHGVMEHPEHDDCVPMGSKQKNVSGIANLFAGRNKRLGRPQMIPADAMGFSRAADADIVVICSNRRERCVDQPFVPKRR